MGVCDGEGSQPERNERQQYERMRTKGMSKSRAAALSNSDGSCSRGGKQSGGSGGGSSQSDHGSGGTKAQKAAAGRKGGTKSSS